MNDIEKYFRENDQRLIHKWNHYFDVYEKHFSRFRNKEVVILEIGVSQGGSLQMWKDYFGVNAKIYGIDVNPKCKDLEEENIKIFIGSQSDRKFLKTVKQQMPPIDILIDDGGHTMNQQIVSYEELFSSIKDNGVYFCEDVHTSYWLGHGGGYKRRGTFIEYSKKFIDLLNAYHSEQRALNVNDFTRSVDSIHFYDSIVVVEKKKRSAPFDEKTGITSFQNNKKTKLQKIQDRLIKESLTTINKTLRFFRLGGFIWK
ncbi:class I SAM-dependent methyltransferase [Arcticibacter eurypsychrophilus]|uniref:class I SAM-dependent methyltransferase n=1 Tax=Arcticibacter eurypsychrophilus TaxID=1434752 RepID=UPI00084DAEDF|nr:class I SAM-dependent methyltransferase [Arcticibacter eurypsychrophilus]